MGDKRETKKRGKHDEEINMSKSQRGREEKGKNFDFISKHWFQFSSAFYSNYVSEQLPYAGHKLGFAVAGCLNR